MTSDSPPVSASVSAISQPSAELKELNPNLQVRFKSEGGRLLLMLPTESENGFGANWSDVWQQFKQRINSGERFWQPNTTVHLIARDRLLDGRQLQAIADTLAETELHLQRVYTSRRQTAVAAATAGFSVEQHTPVSHLNQTTESGQAIAEPLYVEATVRSGMEIRHPGTVIILGDVNPGSSIVAEGDIVVWGSLRGVAHAGSGGNERCLIMALRLEPTQLRIGEHVARAPEKPPTQFQPEVAYVASEGIRITKSTDFTKLRLVSQ